MRFKQFTYPCGHKVKVKTDGRIDIGVTDIIAITDPGHSGSSDIPAMLEPGLHVGQ